MLTRPTPADAIADAYVDELIRLDPLLAGSTGLGGRQRTLPALDPDWLAEISHLRRRTLRALDSVAGDAGQNADATDRITVAALREDLTAAEALHDAGEDACRLNNTSCALTQIRNAFALMPTASEQDWSDVAARLRAVPAALAGYTSSLWSAARNGRVPAIRQVRLGAELAAAVAGADGPFRRIVPDASTPLPASLRRDLIDAADTAAAAYGDMERFLHTELAGEAADDDAVGRERYALHSRTFLGARVDLGEAYAWGQDEVARLAADLSRTARAAVPHAATPAAAMAELDDDPAHVLRSAEEFRRWAQHTIDAAIDALDGVHFDIPEQLRHVECRIAPTPSGAGGYYTAPSSDLTSRPGRVWWAVPAGFDRFSTWRERTTVHHEGVPGHHLQIGQAVFRADSLNTYRRSVLFVSGHGEGWALYAERLADELGLLPGPADRLGLLDQQSMRAARVVLDVGIHCRLPAPASVGGGTWDWDKAWRYLGANVSAAEPFRRFELERYLGWPGQAPSYALGERVWLDLRDRAQAAEGPAFDLRAFHRRALDVGSVGLDVLPEAVLGPGS